MYEINHILVPDCLFKTFPRTRSLDSTYTTRQVQNNSIPKCRLNIYNSSFVPTAINLCNGIPLEIRNLPTLKSLKEVFCLLNINLHIVFHMDNVTKMQFTHDLDTNVY